jgi:pilus assembly protein Flp/PilA
MSKVFAFLKDESGAAAIEYGLIAAGISVVNIATVNAIGSTLTRSSTAFRRSLNKLRKFANWLKPPFTAASAIF